MPDALLNIEVTPWCVFRSSVTSDSGIVTVQSGAVTTVSGRDRLFIR